MVGGTGFAPRSHDVYERSGRESTHRQRPTTIARLGPALRPRGPGSAPRPPSGRPQTARPITSPLLIFGWNQVDFGGMIRFCLQTSTNCSIVTAGRVTA